MKLAKKFAAAVAMAAVCCAMIVPVTASAADARVVLCPPHSYSVINDRSGVNTTTHQYWMGTVTATGEKIYGTCTVTTVVSLYDLHCTRCGQILFDQGSGTTVTHSDCGL